MAVKERINPKTGKKEYKVRYYFMKEGKKRDSETGWFNTQGQAEREAKKLKELKEKEDLHKISERRDKRVVTLYSEFLEELNKEAIATSSNHLKGTFKTGKAIENNYLPRDIQEVKGREIDSYTFKKWLAEIDNSNLAGSSVRNYRKVLVKFNHWLALNGYYLEQGLEEQIEYSINKTKIKPTIVGNKEASGNRAVMSILDFMQITYYYYDAGLELFKNFYYYTMFYVLFFSGMRKEELVGLQWKFIDLREDKRLIHIKNAIAEIEDEEEALERARKEKYQTKNLSSIRIIPIFDFYYDLLVDYKESYRYEFGLSKEEIEECFVFPRVERSGINPHMYTNHDTMYREFIKVQKARKLPKTDIQMLRHSCATFLILPPPNGLGYTETKVKDYFGHTDEEMLMKVYAKLNTIQKSDRMKDTFSDIYRPNADIDKEKEREAKEELIRRIKGDNQKKEKARKLRIFAQIDKVIKDGQQVYYYRPKDKEIIREYAETQKNGKAQIQFIEEE